MSATKASAAPTALPTPTEAQTELQNIEAQMRLTAEALFHRIGDGPDILSDVWRVLDSVARRMANANEALEIVIAQHENAARKAE